MAFSEYGCISGIHYRTTCRNLMSERGSRYPKYLNVSREILYIVVVSPLIDAVSPKDFECLILSQKTKINFITL